MERHTYSMVRRAWSIAKRRHVLAAGPVPVVETETITKVITATFGQYGGCVTISGVRPDYFSIGEFVRLIMSDDIDNYDPVKNATAEITVKLTRPKR